MKEQSKKTTHLFACLENRTKQLDNLQVLLDIACCMNIYEQEALIRKIFEAEPNNADMQAIKLRYNLSFL